jgi:hypothetical protein
LWPGKAGQRLRPEIGEIEQPADLPARRFGDDQRVRRSRGRLSLCSRFLPQFVDPAHGSITAQLLTLGMTQKVTGFAILGSAAITSAAIGRWLSRRQAWLV